VHDREPRVGGVRRLARADNASRRRDGAK